MSTCVRFCVRKWDIAHWIGHEQLSDWWLKHSSRLTLEKNCTFLWMCVKPWFPTIKWPFCGWIFPFCLGAFGFFGVSWNSLRLFCTPYFLFITQGLLGLCVTCNNLCRHFPFSTKIHRMDYCYPYYSNELLMHAITTAIVPPKNLCSFSPYTHFWIVNHTQYTAQTFVTVCH